VFKRLKTFYPENGSADLVCFLEVGTEFLCINRVKLLLGRIKKPIN